MLLFKPGVSLKGLQPQASTGMLAVDSVYQRYVADTLITSVNDGMHMDGSLHYVGQAFDVSTHEIPGGRLEFVVKDLKRALNPAGFDVVLEDKGKPNEHIHVEYDPKS